MKFFILDNNERVSLVSIEKDKAAITHYKDSVMYPFYHKDEVSIDEVNAFIENRCFNRNRPDKDDLLKSIGLGAYDAWKIVRKTSGKMIHDRLSVCFIN